VRATLNILFGCLLLLSQVFAALSPHTINKEGAPCRCCACGNQACPAPQSVPAPTPAPIAAQRESGEAQPVEIQAPVVVESTVPVSNSFLLPTTVRSLLPATLPLYERDCALLI